MLPTVAVFHGGGTFSPSLLVSSAADLCRLQFWVPEDHPELRVMRRFLATLGEVHVYASDSAAELARTLPAPDGVVAYSDVALEPAAAVAEVWGRPFHSPQVAHVLSRKSLQRRALDASRRPVAWTTWPENISTHEVGSIEGPVVVKPDRGAGSRNAFRADSETAARQRLERDFGGSALHIIEQAITAQAPYPGLGDYLSAELVHGPEGWYPIAVQGRFPTRPSLGETGNVMPLPLEPQLHAEVVTTALEALALVGAEYGVCHLEMKLSPDGPVIVDINGRLGGGVTDMLRTASGFDILRETLLIALGRPSGPHRLTWIRHSGKVQVFTPPDASVVPPWPDVSPLLDDPGVTFVRRVRDPGEPVDPLGGTGDAYAVVGLAGDSVDDIIDLRRRVLRAFGDPGT